MYLIVFFFFFKQKTAYEMRISDWSSDVCSSDLAALEIVACRIAQDGRELALAARLTLMDPGHRLAQFAHRIIGILDMHTDRRIGQHAAGGAVLIVKSGLAQRHIELARLQTAGGPLGDRNRGGLGQRVYVSVEFGG